MKLLTRLMSAQGPNAILCRKAGELIKDNRRVVYRLRIALYYQNLLSHAAVDPEYCPHGGRWDTCEHEECVTLRKEFDTQWTLQQSGEC